MFSRPRAFVASSFLAFALLAPLGAQTPAPTGTRLLRSPSVSATHIAFAYANNIWSVERSGGLARRLTSFQGLTTTPHYSPDGKWIAFSGEYTGNVDAYVMPAEGGDPKRLTWHPGADQVQGWTHDGKSIVFASSRATWAPSGAPRFWTVPIEGGVEEPMVLPRAFQGKISPDGTHVAYRMNNSWDDERRNYRGGQNRPIWIVDLKTHDLVSPPWTTSKDIDPVWIGETVYFLSDRDGVHNVWSFDTKSKRLAQLTKFRDYDVKTIDSGGGVLVFEQAGYVHELDPRNGREHVVNITAAGDFPWMMPHWEDVTARMSNLALSPTGRRVAVEARGEVFTIPAEKGDIRNLTQSSGSAERDPSWSPDGKYVSYFSDKSGEYKLVLESPDGLTPPREVALPNPTHYYTPSWSPDSKKLLYTDTNLHVWVLDVASGQAKIVGNDPWMVPERTLNPAWSPDSKWVAYSSRLKSLYHAIFVSNVESGETKQVSDGLSNAVWPAWDASGKYLWFLASTDFGLQSQWLDMTSYDHTENFGLYLAILRKGEPSPLLPESDEDPGVGAAPAPGGNTGGGRAGRGGGSAAGADDPAAQDPAPARGSGARTPVTVQIDSDRLSQRILAIPGVPAREYSQLRAGIAGSVFYLEAAGGGGRGGAGGGGSTLVRYRLSDRRAATFVAGVTAYGLSADARKLVYRTGGGGGGGRGAGAPAAAATVALFIVDADRNAPAAGAGRIDVTLRMYLDPRAEYRQIFHEGWRNQRDYLYVPNTHGTDWAEDREMYGKLLPFVNHRADLNYLLDNMGAEIAVGHSYVRGGDMPEVPTGPAGGLLGADFAIESGRYKITRIYETESWNPDLRAPLAAPGVDVNVGDFVLAINGEELRAPDNIYRLLDGTANRQMALTVGPRPAMDGTRQVTVIPVTSEQGLRTRAWVEDNRRTVERLSNGTLAYVYVPNTGQGGYASFNRYYFAQQDKQGVIVDERFNGGGSAADYIIDVLQRDFDGYFNNVAGDRYPFTSPAAGIWGPKVMIINEMAGSGGDLMPYMFRSRKIGPLVGKRTWGGLVHTADTPGFIDGGSMIAPRGGFFTRDGKWAVENEGVAPDIDVENWPKDVIAGKDAQLERAVQEAMRMLKENPPTRLSKEPPPPTWGKRTGGGGLVATAPGAAPVAQDHQHAGETLGTVHFQTTCNTAAQEQFDRAMTLLHSFEFGAAIEGFTGAAKADSGCAIAYWGIAMGRWTNPFQATIRSPAQVQQGLDAIKQAEQIGAKSERERGYIAAASKLYVDAGTLDQRTRVVSYEKAMAALAAKYPDDREASIFWALSLTASALPTDKTFANQLKAGAILEKLYPEQPNHPGITHYIIHSYDVPALADRALAAAHRYAKIAPSAPHALHMPSHTFTRVGAWQDSIDTNIASAAEARKVNARAEALHATDYMVYAYLQTGQDNAVRKLMDGIPEIAAQFDPNAVVGAAPGSAGMFALAAIPARWVLEHRDWQAAAALKPPAPSRFPYTEAMTYFARALGAAHTGALNDARTSIAALKDASDKLAQANEAYWAEQVAIQRDGAAAFVLLAEHKNDEAIAAMRAVAAREDATEKNAVTPGPIAPARELLGDMLLEVKQPAAALKEYQATLKKEPNRFRAVYGAAKAAELAGDRAAAQTYYRQLLKICEKGDTPGRAELVEARKLAATR
jgi:tricorn protease